MKKKAVIFDVDGTLVHSEQAHYTAWQKALYEQIGAHLTLEEYYPYVGNSPVTSSSLFAKKYSSLVVHKLLQEKEAFFKDLQKKGLPPIQSTVDFAIRLGEYKNRYGLKLGIASAAKKEEILTNLHHLEIEHLFDVIISGQDDLTEYSDPEGVNKPKPYIYLHAAKMLQLSPNECIVIEDSHVGCRAAVDAGCFTVAVPNSYTKTQDLNLAHARIECLSKVSVDEFLHNPKKWDQPISLDS
jgi:beta-phosphoglucomutase-like phosphatase (HAD superfamily)